MFTINVVGFDLHFADMAAVQARILVLCGREELDTAQGEELRELYNIVHWVMWKEEEEAELARDRCFQATMAEGVDPMDWDRHVAQEQRFQDAQCHEAQLLRGSDALS